MGYGQTAGVHRTESYAGIGLRIQQIMNAAPQRAAPYRTTAPPHLHWAWSGIMRSVAGSTAALNDSPHPARTL